MYMTFRWFGPADPVPLRHIRQIPGVVGVVSALHDVPVGQPWTRSEVDRLAATVHDAGLRLSVVESIFVHEDIKLGRPARDRWIDHYCESVRVVGEAGIPVICYNFMPIFDWTRTSLSYELPDGSTALAYDDEALGRIDLSRGTGDLPGWGAAYGAAELQALLDAYRAIDDEALWENLAYFLERVVPVAEAAHVKLAIHPDDPPWRIFGIPRIVVSGAALERVTTLVDSQANGVTFCTGSLGASPDNDLAAAARRLGGLGRIHFAHCRNVEVVAERTFHEAPHPSRFGAVDMAAVLGALHETGFDGPVRPDHGRMIWDETGRPGYGLYDRALGATYLQGLWEGIRVKQTRTAE